MNAQDAKLYLPLVQALAEGKTVEVFNPFGVSPTWCEFTEFNFDKSPDQYRIKPEFKLRPWRPEEVPVGAWLRSTENKFGDYPVSIILSRRGQWVHFIHPINGGMFNCLSQELTHNHWAYSLDHGKTWLPCGIYEQR